LHCSHVPGHIADTPTNSHLREVNLLATHTHLLEIIFPLYCVLNRNGESIQAGAVVVGNIVEIGVGGEVMGRTVGNPDSVDVGVAVSTSLLTGDNEGTNVGLTVIGSTRSFEGDDEGSTDVVVEGLIVIGSIHLPFTHPWLASHWQCLEQ